MPDIVVTERGYGSAAGFTEYSYPNCESPEFIDSHLYIYKRPPIVGEPGRLTPVPREEIIAAYAPGEWLRVKVKPTVAEKFDAGSIIYTDNGFTKGCQENAK